MRSKDLRIGNLVDRFDKQVKLQYINPEETMDYKPIPLTEDWLIKLNFKKEYHENEFPENGYYFTLDFFDNVYEDLALISNDDNTKVSLFPFSKEYKYVHEIQNLVHSLTGKEIIIKQ